MGKKLIIHNGKFIWRFKIIGDREIWNGEGDVRYLVEELAEKAGYTVIHTGDGSSDDLPDEYRDDPIILRNPFPSGNEL